MSLSYINETLDPNVFAEKSQHCCKTQLQPQWNSRTAGNKRRFCHNVMKTLELLQHRSKQSEGDSTQGSHWGLLSHLHISATLSHCVLFFYVFLHFLLAKSFQKPCPQGRIKQKRIRTENPQLMPLSQKDLQGSPCIYMTKKGDIHTRQKISAINTWTATIFASSLHLGRQLPVASSFHSCQALTVNNPDNYKKGTCSDLLVP